METKDAKASKIILMYECGPVRKYYAPVRASVVSSARCTLSYVPKEYIELIRLAKTSVKKKRRICW